MVSKAKTKKTLKQFTPQRANIASTGGVPLELPNHSRGKAPEADRGLANKQYVDAAVAAGGGGGITNLDGGNSADTFIAVGLSPIDGGDST